MLLFLGTLLGRGICFGCTKRGHVRLLILLTFFLHAACSVIAVVLLFLLRPRRVRVVEIVTVRSVLVHGATAAATPANDDVVVVLEVDELVASRPGAAAVTVLDGRGSGRPGVDGLAALCVGIVDRIVGVFRALDRGAIGEVFLWHSIQGSRAKAR